MSIPRAASASIDLSKRDLTLDLARVFCVLFVVVIHLLMTGVIVDARSGIGLQRTLELQPWYALATWVGQIMPLFFVIGGFAGLTAWRSLQRRGGDAPGYVTSRLLRLARPAFPLFVFYIVAIGAGLIIIMTTGLLGFPVLDAVIIGVGSPLWFIAAYAISQAFLPFLARMHEVAPKRTVLVLLVGVILVDVLRYSTADLGMVEHLAGTAQSALRLASHPAVRILVRRRVLRPAVVAAGADLARLARDAVAAHDVRPVRGRHARQPEPADPGPRLHRTVAGGVPAAAEASALRPDAHAAGQSVRVRRRHAPHHDLPLARADDRPGGRSRPAHPRRQPRGPAARSGGGRGRSST